LQRDSFTVARAAEKSRLREIAARESPYGRGRLVRDSYPFRVLRLRANDWRAVARNIAKPDFRGRVMFLGLSTFTWVHTLLSLVGIVTGLVVLKGLFSSERLDGWTALFMASAVATSVTGFMLPADHFGPSHWVGVISLVALAFAILARYGLHLAGAWRWIYAVGAAIALYFLLFVGVAQLFAKVPALHVLAPTQAEPPFAIAEGALLVLFLVLTVMAAIKFRPRAA
jgi:hypothetical protein